MKKKCFVIMGYGIKTDYSTGRDLDLDKTYKNIIKPVVEECGLECIRADEIKHTGTIDIPMYKYLYESDIVIADLSTSNPNALYELGVRHGLKPFTTIAIAEKKLKYPFDLNHTVIRQYEHLCTDIGFDEVMRFREELKGIINQILVTQDIDSPVYTFLHSLEPPKLKNQEKQPIDQRGESLREIIDSGLEYLKDDNFIKAGEQFKKALTIDKDNIYLIQKYALATYKSETPSISKSLNDSLEILQKLDPDTTNDPETLGLLGAIWKRKYFISKDIKDLTKSINYYEKGFYLKNDYYNGINLAYLYNERSCISSNPDDKTADSIIAYRIRQKVIVICLNLIDSKFDERNDKYWIFATLQEAYLGIRDIDNYEYYKKKSLATAEAKWQIETTNIQIDNLKKLL